MHKPAGLHQAVSMIPLAQVLHLLHAPNLAQQRQKADGSRLREINAELKLQSDERSDLMFAA